MLAGRQIIEAMLDRLDPRRFTQHATDAQGQYTFHGQNLELFESTAPEVVISGAAGTGKSLCALQKLNYCAWRYPGMRALIVRKTRTSLTESGLYTFEEWILGPDNPICNTVRRSHRLAYQYPNGSLIVVGGMDKPTRILSSEYGLIFVQEALELSEGDWEILLTRVRHTRMPFHQLLGDTNPGPPTHWLALRAAAHKTVLLHGKHEDNPMLYNHAREEWTPAGIAYLARLDQLSGHRYDRLRWGRWVQAEGAVYPMWTPHKHLVDPFKLDKYWRRFIAVDFGYRNPFVALWFAVSPDGVIFCYREIYMTERLVSDHAEQIKALSAGEAIEAVVCDHDAEGRATLERAGLHTVAAKKDMSLGIQAVQKRLRYDDNTEPRLYFFRDALVETDKNLADAKRPVCTEQEFPGYVWAPAIRTDSIREVPVDVDNHSMDCVRYAIMYVDDPGTVAYQPRYFKGLFASRDRMVQRFPRGRARRKARP